MIVPFITRPEPNEIEQSERRLHDDIERFASAVFYRRPEARRKYLYRERRRIRSMVREMEERLAQRRLRDLALIEGCDENGRPEVPRWLRRRTVEEACKADGRFLRWEDYLRSQGKTFVQIDLLKSRDELRAEILFEDKCDDKDAYEM